MYAEARLRQPCAAPRADRQRDAEITDDGLTTLEQDVARLDVVMHDPTGVRKLERARHGSRNTNCLVHRKLSLCVESVPKALPFHIRHHVEEEGVGLSRVI